LARKEAMFNDAMIGRRIPRREALGLRQLLSTPCRTASNTQRHSTSRWSKLCHAR
jgi:hypothetical protein